MLYVNEESGVDELLDFESGNLAIGVWIAIRLHMASMIVALIAKKDNIKPDLQENTD